MKKIYFKVLNNNRYSARCIYNAINYPPNTRVKAHDNTPGIFVFDKLENAKRFRENGETIIKVIGHGRSTRPKMIIAYNFSIHELFKHILLWKGAKTATTLMEAPKGTVCFKEITTLE